MDDQQKRLNHLLAKLNMLESRHELVSREITELKSEVEKMRSGIATASPEDEAPPTKIDEPHPAHKFDAESTEEPVAEAPEIANIVTQRKKEQRFSIKADVEKFIGENLINKIGIAITIIGVGLGVKYSVEHDLVTPLMRVISGYLAGFVMLLIGFRLKTRYEQYSAVLVSGAMAIMYFITFAAYSFYDLMPVGVSFGLMVLFTAFLVIAAIQYDQQVISLIGMVGAYAVPFLLSDDSGNVVVLLSYVSIINAGILFIAFRRYWKILYYSAFTLSWLIFVVWHVGDFRIGDHFAIALIFATIFFLTFYVTFLAYKLLKKETFDVKDILVLIINSFVFFGIGYLTLELHEIGEELLGLFTVGNAIVHFAVSVVVFRQQLADKKLFFLVIGLVLVFIAIAIPVQLDGNWVTLLWIGEAALLFWIGRSKDVQMYEKMSYPLIVLASVSLLQDFDQVYDRYIQYNPESIFTPFLNIHILSSLLFVAGMGLIVRLQNSRNYSVSSLPTQWAQLTYYGIPTIFLGALFLSFRYEIANYWDQLHYLTAVEIGGGPDYSATIIRNDNIPLFKSIWLIIYAMIFAIALSAANIFKMKHSELGLLNIVLNAIVLYIFLLHGLYVLSELRENYLSQHQAEYFQVGYYNIAIRYISLLISLGVIAISYWYIRQPFIKQSLEKLTAMASYLAVLWILSSELLHWLDFAGVKEAYKLWLSILWGSYSLMLIVIGIWKQQRYLRIMAIAIFGATLVKLFFYDVSHLDALSKIILFVSLGVLLLIISFLYNKYKPNSSDEA